MKWTVMFVALFLMCFPMLALSQASADGVQGTPLHDREFWRAIAKNRYAVPDGQAVFSLLRELSGYLGSRDPELRDNLAYSITTVWIKHQKQISTDELYSLLDEWQANLWTGIGETGNDGVLKRSFSALSLVALAARDLKMPFLGEGRYRTFLANALAYLSDERDLRGFDPTLGWIHAAAHSADLLAALAANPLLKNEDQARLLDAIARCLSSAHEIFTHGEQDRLSEIAAGGFHVEALSLSRTRVPTIQPIRGTGRGSSRNSSPRSFPSRTAQRLFACRLSHPDTAAQHGASCSK